MGRRAVLELGAALQGSPGSALCSPHSILGMHLFGCKFASERDGDTLPDRKNFDSLLWAIVTVFQVRSRKQPDLLPLGLWGGGGAAAAWLGRAPVAGIGIGTLVTARGHVQTWDACLQTAHPEQMPVCCSLSDSPEAFSLQILTQEDWNKVLYNGMASTSSWAALYFIALMTFGNYVLFNLLVAILVEGFQTEVMFSHSCLCWL